MKTQTKKSYIPPLVKSVEFKMEIGVALSGTAFPYGRTRNSGDHFFEGNDNSGIFTTGYDRVGDNGESGGTGSFF
ncbi:MAG: hypothetical protein MJZ86_00590 [Bacteroidales bacterium]|nr:hypothetical protein [Bacteroidales bacterium]